MSKLSIKEWHDRTIYFKTKQILLSFPIKKGICSFCNKKNGDKYITTRKTITETITHIHHIEYYIIFKWFATIEICKACHTSVTFKKK